MPQLLHFEYKLISINRARDIGLVYINTSSLIQNGALVGEISCTGLPMVGIAILIIQVVIVGSLMNHSPCIRSSSSGGLRNER